MIRQATIVLKYISLRRRMMNAPYFYTSKQVMHTVWRLLHVAPEIQEAFIVWFEHGIEPNLQYGDLSYADIRYYMKFNEFNAFLYMDYAKRNPEEARIGLLDGKRKPMEIKKEDMRSELREYVEQEEALMAEEERKQGRIFSDTDEIKFKDGKSFTVMLEK